MYVRREAMSVSFGPQPSNSKEPQKQECALLDQQQLEGSLNLFGLDLFSLFTVVITSENSAITLVPRLSVLALLQVIITVANLN